MNNVMNIVNFVRGCEPRKPMDLLTPIAEEIKIDKSYGFKHTFLLQYDALLREDMVELFKREKDADMELGLWFEMCRPLTEKVGIEWRGREGFDWDWYVNPGFLPAYTPKQREALIDEVFELFKKTFGYYPKSAGSWLLDAHSMAYMSDKYGMDAFCICREQYAVDAYTLWGGYYSGGYYPSRNNMLCPSQSNQTKINTPVFRMLGIDPIYGYDEKKHSPKIGGCFTMEPVWPCGADGGVMDWYFEQYYSNTSLALSQATTGQENSFGWERIEGGYRMQMQKLYELQKSGTVRIELLGKTGADFKMRHSKTPASALSALRDWSNNGIQSIWYSSAKWRANLFLKKGRLIFRDIQKFDDRYTERYLTAACEGWLATYDNLPVVDNRLWSKDEKECAWIFKDTVETIESSMENENGELEITVRFSDGHSGVLTFAENGFTARDCGNIIISLGECDTEVKADGNKLYFRRNCFDYVVGVDGKLTVTNSGYKAESISEILSVQMDILSEQEKNTY